MVAVIFSAPGSWAQPPSKAVTPRYDLAVKIMPETSWLEGTGTLWLPEAAEPRRRVDLVLAESMQLLAVDVLEPRAIRGHPTIARRERPASSPGWGSAVLTITPGTAFPAGQPVALRLSWAGGKVPGFVFHLGPDASFGGGVNTAWYPQVLEPSGGTATAVGRLSLKVPLGYTAIASGAAEMERPATGEFRFLAAQPTYFSFAAARYQVLRQDGVVPTAIYSLRPRRDAERVLQSCARILELLVREYGPHPYGNRFAVVEIPTEALAGSSGASFENFMFSNSASLDSPFNPKFYAHEIGHIWWGNLIKRRGARGRLMMDEGMADYSAMIALEALEGPAAAERLRRHGDPASPIEQSASTYCALAAGGLDRPLADLPNDWGSKNLASTKGVMVMDLLARTIGRDRFREILHAFIRQFAFQKATWDQLVEAFDQGTGGELRSFFSQWFDRAGQPDWRITWSQEGATLRGAITQETPFFGGLVDVELTDTTGRRAIRQVTIAPEARTEFLWTVEGTIGNVVIDPEFRAPHWTPELRAEAPLLAPYWQAFAKEESGQHDAALADLAAALRKVPVPDTMGVRFGLEELTGRLLASDPKTLADARLHLQRALMSPSRRADRLGWTYYLLGYVGKGLADSATLEQAMDGATSADAVTASWSGWGDATRALSPPTAPVNDH
jgi:hypothetical protein